VEVVNDQILAERMGIGDQTAFELLLHRYQPLIFNHLEHLLKDKDKAEDFVQETFLKFLNQLQCQNIPMNIRAWLYSVATNLCRDYWRSSCFRREQQILEQLPEPRDGRGQVIDLFVHRENRMEIRNLLNELPEREREIIILRFYNELKLKEIAEVLACPLGTVKSRLFHTLRTLKSRIQEKGYVNYG
jgi:RNA polymerase sigma factor (sigma-70 family)